MNGRNSLDRFEIQLRDWLTAEAGEETPDYAEAALARVATVEQRPAWRSPSRWLPPLPALPPLPRLEGPRALAVVVALLILAALVAGALGVGRESKLPPPFGRAVNGLVVFDTAGDIQVAAADGSNRHAITTDAAMDFGAVWSPDGTRLAYWSAPAVDGRFATLWVADADGSDAQPLTAGQIVDADPSFPAASWASDSRRLAFSTQDGHLFVVRADGTELREIGGSNLRRYDPSWSPMDDLIAFYGEGDPGVYVIRPDGAGETEISSGSSVPVSLRLPSWSPDGLRVAYHVQAIVDDADVVVATRAAGAWKQSVLIGGAASDAWPRSSNDGQRIAFVRSTPPYAEGTVWIASADGSNERQLSTDVVAWAPVCFTPDDRAVLAVGGEFGAPVGAEERPRYLVMSLDASTPTVTIDVPGRLAFAACSWQRLAQ